MNIDNLICEWAESIKNDYITESDDYSRAKKLGYMGGKDQDRIANWLKGSYAKWKQYCLDVFTRVANGDEEKALDWFYRYGDLSQQMIGLRTWSSKHNRYVDQQEQKKELEDEIGDDAEVKELMDKLEEKWKRDAESLTEYYENSRYQGD